MSLSESGASAIDKNLSKSEAVVQPAAKAVGNNPAGFAEQLNANLTGGTTIPGAVEITETVITKMPPGTFPGGVENPGETIIISDAPKTDKKETGGTTVPGGVENSGKTIVIGNAPEIKLDKTASTGGTTTPGGVENPGEAIIIPGGPGIAP